MVAAGLPHHVAQRGNNRADVFFDDDDRRFYLWKLAEYRRKYRVDIWGYCLMTNHMHALAVPTEPDSLARCFAGTNLIYTQHVNRKYTRSGRLWQNRFFSCPVDKDEYLWPVLRYIDRNPVRAKLVEQAWEYVWSSARHHVTGREDPVLNEPDWLLADMQRQKYRSYLRDDSEEAAAEIRRRTATGRPLGDDGFLSALESRLHRAIGVRLSGRPRRDSRK